MIWWGRGNEKESYPADEFYIFSFNILNNHDFHFSQEMKSKITDSISEEEEEKKKKKKKKKKAIRRQFIKCILRNIFRFSL